MICKSMIVSDCLKLYYTFVTCLYSLGLCIRAQTHPLAANSAFTVAVPLAALVVERQSHAIVVSGCEARGTHVHFCVFVLCYADTCSVAGGGETSDRSGLVPTGGVRFAIITQGQVRPVRGGESALHILGMGCKQEQQGNI
jgi:hypothetical protein